MRCACVILIATIAGCQAAPEQPAQEIVGYWTPIGAAQFVENDGSKNHPIIAGVLAEHDIPVEFQYKGIAVPWFKADQAREVLMTDTRLSGRDITVIFAVSAGTAEKTQDGFTIPDIRQLPPSTE